LVGNYLVVVASARSSLRINRFGDLADHPALSRLAMGHPESVPAGIYAKQALVAAGIWERVSPRVIRAHDVREALLFVERGEADAGIVYRSDARGANVSMVHEIDASLHEPIVYPLALLGDSGAASPAATRVFEYLLSPDAAAVLLRHGFAPIQHPPASKQSNKN